MWPTSFALILTVHISSFNCEKQNEINQDISMQVYNLLPLLLEEYKIHLAMQVYNIQIQHIKYRSWVVCQIVDVRDIFSILSMTI